MTIRNKIGLVFIVVGLASNEWILKFLFSSDNVLEPRTRVIILCFEIFLILTGVVIYKYARSLPNFVLTIIINVCVFLALIFGLEIVFFSLNKKPNILIETISLSQEGIDS